MRGRNRAQICIWGKHAAAGHMRHVGGRTQLIHRVLWVRTGVRARVLRRMGNCWRLVRIDAVWTTMLGSAWTLARHEGGKVLRGGRVWACWCRAGGRYRDAVWLRAGADDGERYLSWITWSRRWLGRWGMVVEIVYH